MAAQDGRELLATAVRTLLLAGYDVTNSITHPRHTQVYCNRIGELGAITRVLFAFTEEPQLTERELEDLQADAAVDGRSLIAVSRHVSTDQISWEEFFDALGGAVAAWRALSPDYGDALLTASKNILPEGAIGQAWAIFEDLLADGLEFLLGRRSRRMGGRRRGKAVTDLLTELPDGGVLVVDAKATAGSFNCTVTNLRALGEYVQLQQRRNRGYNEVVGALIVSSEFKQDAEDLLDVSRQFQARYSAPATFLAAEDLSKMVGALQRDSVARQAVHWRGLFSGGHLSASQLAGDLRDLREERYPDRR